MATYLTSNTGNTKSTDRTAGGSKPDNTPATGTTTTGGGGGTGTVTQLNQGTGITLTPSPITGVGTIANAGVTKIISGGSNVSLSPTSGVGDVTISVAATSSGVTQVNTAGTVNGITLTGGPITTIGTVTLGGTLSGIANSQLTNSSVTVTAGTGLSGGGTVALGGTITLTNSSPGFSNPMSALGDTIYGGSSPAGTPTRLAGNNVNTLYKLTQTGTGSASAIPVWKQDNIFNVKDYGAIGNGSADDTTSIQNAITAAIAVNGCVYFPAGTYAYGSTTDLSIVCNGSISFKGDGWRVSKLLYLGTSNALYCTISGGSYPEGNSVSIYNLAVLANAPGTGSGAAATTGVTIHYGNSFGAADEIHPNCLIDGLYIGSYLVGNYAPQYVNSGFVYGLTLNNMCQSHVQNVYLYGNSSNFDQQSTAGAGTCGAGSGRGLWLNNAVNNFFSNINVRFWGQGIYLDCSSGNNNQGCFFTGVNGVTNCEFFTTTGLVDSWNLVNFQCDNGNYVSSRTYPYPSTIRGIVIESNFSSINPGFGGRIADGFGTIDSHFGGPCLLLNGTTGIQVSNCRFYAGNSSYPGTKITGSTTDCILTNVWSQGGGSYYGVQIDSGCSGITYAMGSTRGSGAILDNGTSDIIQYNQT